MVLIEYHRWMPDGLKNTFPFLASLTKLLFYPFSLGYETGCDQPEC